MKTSRRISKIQTRNSKSLKAYVQSSSSNNNSKRRKRTHLQSSKVQADPTLYLTRGSIKATKGWALPEEEEAMVTITSRPCTTTTGAGTRTITMAIKGSSSITTGGTITSPTMEGCTTIRGTIQVVVMAAGDTSRSGPHTTIKVASSSSMVVVVAVEAVVAALIHRLLSKV